MSTEPNWVQRNPEKYRKRMFLEAEQLKSWFPKHRFQMFGDGTLYTEGPLITKSKNLYTVRLIYPDNYPYSPPAGVVMDRDVLRWCKEKGAHEYHQYGEHTSGGLHMCLLSADDTYGNTTGWKPTDSAISLLYTAGLWLNGFEVKKQTGIWILPEA